MNINELRNNIYKFPPDTLLILSSEYNYFNGVKVAIERGADVNTHSLCAIRNAVLKNNYEITKCLINNGSLITSDIFRYAIQSNNLEIVRILDDYFGCELYYNAGIRESTKNNNYEITKYLLETGADIHYFCEIALSNAINNKNEKLISYLLENGADPNRLVYKFEKDKLFNILRNSKIKKIIDI